MKKIIVAVLCAAMLLVSAGTLVGCGDKRTVYTVTVVGGEGGGRYYENDNVKVTATVPDGKQFLKWVSDGESVSSEEEYVFTLTEDVSLTAVFGDAAPGADKDVFSVKTSGGVGDGGYLKGSACTVKVVSAEADRSFKGWFETDKDGNYIGKDGQIVKTDGDGYVLDENGDAVLDEEENPIHKDTLLQAVSIEQTYTFTVEKNVNLKAEFNDVRLNTPFGTLCRISSTPSWGDVIVELDRVKDENGNAIKNDDGSPATMFDGRIQYILIHVYDSIYSNKPVAAFKFMQEEDIQSGKLVTIDGAAEFTGIKGGAGNYFRDWIGINDFVPFMRAVVGESYSAETTYYFASQLIAKEGAVEWKGKPTVFASSRISGFNSEHYRENDRRK